MLQQHEIEEFKEKTAKITAISKGNELIKAEVLVKLQQAQTLIENEEKKHNEEEKKHNIEEKKHIVEEHYGALSKMQQRKRKISADKVEHKVSTDIVTNNHIINKEALRANSTKKVDKNVKPFEYKTADYKKFFNQSNKDHKQKQPKQKFKKYKK